MRFVAIDFETANASRSSVCALGLVVVEDGTLVDSKAWLVRPEPLWFDGYNIMIHGITEDDVRDKPTFDQWWRSTFRSYFEHAPLLAHNAAFDMSVLRHVLDQYGIEYPHTTYYCTRIIAKRSWPGLESYSLDTVADHLGIDFVHHDPLEDAVASARIAGLAVEKHRAADLPDLAGVLGFKRGELFAGGYHPCCVLSPGGGGISLKSLTPSTAEIDDSHPFYGKLVVFTGALDFMTRMEAAQRVVDCGGRCADGMSRWVNFLVLGQQDYRKLKGQEKSGKMRKAESFLAAGADIEVIPENDFLEMLGDATRPIV